MHQRQSTQPRQREQVAPPCQTHPHPKSIMQQPTQPSVTEPKPASCMTAKREEGEQEESHSQHAGGGRSSRSNMEAKIGQKQKQWRKQILSGHSKDILTQQDCFAHPLWSRSPNLAEQNHQNRSAGATCPTSLFLASAKASIFTLPLSPAPFAETIHSWPSGLSDTRCPQHQLSAPSLSISFHQARLHFGAVQRQGMRGGLKMLICSPYPRSTMPEDPFPPSPVGPRLILTWS